MSDKGSLDSQAMEDVHLHTGENVEDAPDSDRDQAHGEEEEAAHAASPLLGDQAPDDRVAKVISRNQAFHQRTQESPTSSSALRAMCQPMLLPGEKPPSHVMHCASIRIPHLDMERTNAYLAVTNKRILVIELSDFALTEDPRQRKPTSSKLPSIAAFADKLRAQNQGQGNVNPLSTLSGFGNKLSTLAGEASTGVKGPPPVRPAANQDTEALLRGRMQSVTYDDNVSQLVAHREFFYSLPLQSIRDVQYDVSAVTISSHREASTTKKVRRSLEGKACCANVSFPPPSPCPTVPVIGTFPWSLLCLVLVIIGIILIATMGEPWAFALIVVFGILGVICFLKEKVGTSFETCCVAKPPAVEEVTVTHAGSAKLFRALHPPVLDVRVDPGDTARTGVFQETWNVEEDPEDIVEMSDSSGTNVHTSQIGTVRFQKRFLVVKYMRPGADAQPLNRHQLSCELGSAASDEHGMVMMGMLQRWIPEFRDAAV